MSIQSAKLYPATHLFFLCLRALLLAKICAAETNRDISFYHRKLRGSTFATDNRGYEDIHRTKYQPSPHVYRTVTDNYQRRRVLLANIINETESGGFTNNNSNTSDAKPSEPKKIPVPLPLMPKKTPSPTLQPSPAAALLDRGAGPVGSAPSAGDDPSAAGSDRLPTDSSGDGTESNSNGSSSGSSSSSSGSEDHAASASVDPTNSNIGQRGRVYPLLVAFVGIVFLAACVCYPLLRRQQQQTIAISSSGSAKDSSSAAASAWSTQQQQQKYARVPHEDADMDKDGDFEMPSALVRRSSSRSPMFSGLEGGGGRGGGQVGKDVNSEISPALRFNADSDNHHDYGDGGAHSVQRAKSMDSSVGAGLRININPMSSKSATTGKTIARGFSTDADDLFESIGIAATPTFRPASRQPTPKSSAGSPSRLTVVAGGSEKATNSRRNIFGERAQQGTTIGTGGTADNIKVNVNVRGLPGDAIHTERESGIESGTGFGMRSIDEMSEKLALELRQLDDSENFKVVGSSSGPLAPSGSAARFAQRMGLVGAGAAATSSAVALGLASSGSTATITAAAAAGEGIRSAAVWEEEGGGGVDDDDNELNELLASDRDI